MEMRSSIKTINIFLTGLSGEPSYQGETPEDQEMYLNMFYRGKEERWVWNDVPNDIIAVVNSYSGTVGYICEYEN